MLEVLKPIELATYVALGQYADNKTKECWPSVTKLAKDINRIKTKYNKCTKRSGRKRRYRDKTTF